MDLRGSVGITGWNGLWVVRRNGQTAQIGHKSTRFHNNGKIGS